jgi:hypothetical protein
VVVDGDADVIFLDEFFDAREGRGSGIAGDDGFNAGALAVFEFGADVVIIVFLEIDGSGCVKVDAVGFVIGYGLGFVGVIVGQVVLYVLSVEGADAELLHKGNELGAAEVAEGVAGEAQADGRGVAGGLGEICTPPKQSLDGAAKSSCGCE